MLILRLFLILILIFLGGEKRCALNVVIVMKKTVEIHKT